jgi:hypothetical protein
MNGIEFYYKIYVSRRTSVKKMSWGKAQSKICAFPQFFLIQITFIKEYDGMLTITCWNTIRTIL